MSDQDDAAWVAFFGSCVTRVSLRLGLQGCRLKRVTKDRLVVCVESALQHRMLRDAETRAHLDALATRAYGRPMHVSIVFEAPSDIELARRHRRAGTLQ